MKGLKNITILYVDDEDINLLIFERTFGERYSVITASSGEEGLDILSQRSDQIGVVISDMKMFEMNGVEFITAAKAKYPELACFILTGFAFDDEIENALEANLISEAFSKPFDMNRVEKAIRNVMNSD